MMDVGPYVGQWEFHRARTLATLDAIGDDASLLTRPPAPGRAAVGWHLMHVASVEERFAIDRLGVAEPAGGRLAADFGKGSGPAAEGVTAARVRETLDATRTLLLSGVSRLEGFAADETPDFLADRGWTVSHFLHLIGWHEAHHQGQAHAVLNVVRGAT